MARELPRKAKAIPLPTGNDLALMRAVGLTKAFRAHRSFWPTRPRQDAPQPALQNVDLVLPQGHITALVGPNGAGKTTLMRCLAGILIPDAGHVELDGAPLQPHRADLRARIGFVVADDRSFHQRLSAAQNLQFFARLHRLDPKLRASRVERALTLAQLADRADSPYRTLSTGMNRRLGFARALLGDPDVLLMDEASSGLDPEAREHFHEALQAWIRERRCAVLLATHDLAEVERLATDVIVLERGVVQAVGRWDAVQHAAQRVFPNAKILDDGRT